MSPAPKPARYERQAPRRKPKDDRFTTLLGEDPVAATRRMLTEGMPEVSQTVLQAAETATSKRIREQARRLLERYTPSLKATLRDLAENGRTKAIRDNARRSLEDLERKTA